MIFILGGKGFVGSAFVRFCKNNNLKYKIINKTNYSKFKNKKCCIFINAAGNSSKLLGQNNPLEDFKKSVEITRKTLDDFDYEKYVLISSCDVYPDCSSIKKTLEKNNIDVSKQSVYGFHKYLAEQCVVNKVNNWLILRLGGMVGDGMKKNPIFDILFNKKLWVNPKSEFQFITTDNVANITFHLLNNVKDNEIFNICGNGMIKLENVIKIVGKKIQTDLHTPKLIYNVNIKKIKRYTKIPDSKLTVNNFVKQFLN